VAGATHRSVRCLALAITLLIAWADVPASAQSITLSVAGGSVSVRAPGFGFIKGEALARLRDGRSVRVDLELAILSKPGEPPVAGSRRTCVLSYDLWEERFAAGVADDPPRATSNRTVADAEGWCIEQLTVPVGALGSLGSDRPLWVRLDSRVQDGSAAPAQDDGTGLRWLIETLGRRRKADALTRTIEAGPLMLPR
jgi:hypothetical protein